MSRTVTLRSAARLELAEAVLWYERERTGLGKELSDEVDRRLAEIAKQPEKYPIAHKDVREAPVSEFPYSIFYCAKPERIVVLSVFHNSRDPAVWQALL